MLLVMNSIWNDCETERERDMRLQRKRYRMLLLGALYIAVTGVEGNFLQL